MTKRLLNAGKLFQSLFTRDLPEPWVAYSDLDVGSFDDIPIATHSAVIQQNGNGEDVWSVTLTVNLFLDPAGAFDRAAFVYAVIHAWDDDPEESIIPGVGAIESVDDLDAFMPASGEVLMNNKAVRHYQGAFSITAKVH
ncbi:hypothetical protein [Microbacterium trichothecenolyticum]|uniref:Uncharacterized protein n=1 Tax=Microbacterium trichothecenolyticum TaxID=69370 RepID=A0A0M2H7J2_MICTR|nr:hypothetical protein [Microbacterium trichothecenolyticum]KJL39909.1 hypothetical protein RS82_04122 [Microbacterium trichothecenolyticum]